MTKFHKKRDGWLMVRADGSCRYLGLWEGVRYRLFGTEPKDAQPGAVAWMWEHPTFRSFVALQNDVEADADSGWRVTPLFTHPATVAVAWFTEDYLTDKSATTYDPVVAERWRNKGWPVTPLYAATSEASP